VVAHTAVVSYALGSRRIAVEDPLTQWVSLKAIPPSSTISWENSIPASQFSVKIRPPHEVIPALDGSDFFCSLIVMHYDDATALSCTAKGLEPRLQHDPVTLGRSFPLLHRAHKATGGPPRLSQVGEPHNECIRPSLCRPPPLHSRQYRRVCGKLSAWGPAEVANPRLDPLGDPPPPLTLNSTSSMLLGFV
jgi:hypothetical protein